VFPLHSAFSPRDIKCPFKVSISIKKGIGLKGRERKGSGRKGKGRKGEGR
jgi:hypothetical protein